MCTIKYRIEVQQNLKQDLEINTLEIQNILSVIKHEGSFYDYIGIFHDYEADSALLHIRKKLYDKYKIIFKDYDALLSKHDLRLLLAHIDKIEEMTLEELNVNNVDLSAQYVWKDAMGVAHETTEAERRDDYEARLKHFSHQLFLQRIRTQNAFQRRWKERRSNQFAIWAPFIVSVLALITSIASIYISVKTGGFAK